jgi:spermidine dehydrogenase
LHEAPAGSAVAITRTSSLQGFAPILHTRQAGAFSLQGYTISMSDRTKAPADRALGLDDTGVTRRDFLGSSLLASGAGLLTGLAPRDVLAQNGLGWQGFSGVGDYKDANGNTEPVINGAHSMRDGNYDQPPPETIDTGETYDAVVVGGGIAGLSAALLMKARAKRPLRILILENHGMFGGEARRNDFLVNGHRIEGPQGSNFLEVPRPGNLIDQTYKLCGLDPRAFQYQTWKGRGEPVKLSRHNYDHFFAMPKNFGFFFGAKYGQPDGLWVTDPWGSKLEGCSFPAAMRDDLLKWRAFTSKKGWAPKDLFDLSPQEKAHLDGISDEDRWIEMAGMDRESVRTFISPMVAQMVGLGADAVSGLYMYTWHRSNGDDPDPAEKEPAHCFPGGNAGVSRHLVKALIPEAIAGSPAMDEVWKGRVRFTALDRPENDVRLRVSAMAVRVEHDGDPARAEHVNVTYAKDGHTFRVRARGVIMAGGGWASKRIVRDLPSAHRAAYDTFSYSAFLVANVAVRNWRFLHRLGLSGGRWFEGFGHWTEVRTLPTFAASSKTVGPDQPTVLTFYMPLMYPGDPTPLQGTRGRTELIGTPYVEYERRIREHLQTAFGKSGFDARRDIAGIVLNRWGHAFVNPAPGFFVGKNVAPAPRDVIRARPFGRIAFSHGDLAGTVNHMHSITESDRAARQLMEVLGA